MSAAEHGMDPVLRRLPGAAWRSLPALAVAGVVAVGAWWVAGWMLGVDSPVVSIAAGLVCGAMAAVAVDAVEREVFDLGRGGSRRWRSAALAMAVGAVAGGLAAWSTFAAVVAEAAASALLQVTAVASAVAVAAVIIVAAVALPVVAARPDATARAVLIAGVVAVVRRPLPSVAAVLCSAAIAWLGLTWFAGLLVFVVPVFATLAVAAAWSSAAPLGVALPPLSPLARRSVAPDLGAA